MVISVTNSPTIAIIGGGFSGTMVATHLLRLAACPLKIKLIEKRGELGRGIAYSTPVEEHLLNVPALKMSAFPDAPEHFLNWIQRYYLQKKFTASTFVPRKYYGEYIQSVLHEAQEQASEGVKLDRLKDEAIALKLEADQVIIDCRSGEQIKADCVVLALGNLPPSDPPIDDRSFYQSGRYISWAWSTPLENIIEPEAPILLVGSGLTAIDSAIDLYHKGHQGKIHIISRRGLLPQPHQQTPAYPSFIQTEQNLKVLCRQVRQEIRKAQAIGYDWRAVIDSLRPHTQQIWRSLSIVEKRRFLRHLRTYWDIHRHRVAPDSDRILTKLKTSQQLILHAGRIESYREDLNGVDVVIRPRCSEHSEIVRVQTVVNCTGSERLASQWQHPLLNNLIASGIAKPDSLQLGLDVAENGAIISASGIQSSTIYTLGALQKGCLWETTAVPEIRQQAEILARELLRHDYRQAR